MFYILFLFWLKHFYRWHNSVLKIIIIFYAEVIFL